MPLALSPDSVQSPSFQAPWQTHRRPLSNASRGRSNSRQSAAAARDKFINTAERISRRTVSTFMKFTLFQKILAVTIFLGVATFGILFLVYNEKIFGWLEPLAEKWKSTTGGWVILWAITFLVALPPMIGYSTCATTAGFVYGIGEGWLILASATIAGSFFAFLVSRTVLKRYVERLVANDKRFAALTLTLRHDGLRLLCMIRLCPLPYSLSNGALSTFPSVHPAIFTLATAIVTPKLLVHCFIGSRLAAIAKSGESMSAGTRAVNYASIVAGATLGIFTGWYIYQKTMARVRELEQEEIQNARNPSARTGVPPRDFVDDPEAGLAATTLAEDDDDDDLDYLGDATSPVANTYKDETDDEDVFVQGDEDPQSPRISMQRHKAG